VIVLTQSGAARILESYFSDRELYLRLFTSNLLMNPTLESLQEAKGGGYKPIRLLGPWAVLDNEGVMTAKHPDEVFRFTGELKDGAAIYGVFVTEGADIIFAERAQASFIPRNNGDTYTVGVRFQLK